MSEYHKQLINDAITLGATPPGSIDDPRSLYQTVTSFSKHSPDRVLSTRPNLQTEFGNRAFDLLQKGVLFKQSLDGFCSDAESRLLLATDPVIIRNPHLTSPTVIEHEGKRIGVVKPVGNGNLYGLADSPEHNIYAGCWHSITPLEQPKKQSQFVAVMPAERISATPVRFSVFTTDTEANGSLVSLDLSDGDRDVLTTSHESIVHRVENAYKASQRSLKP